MKLNRKYLRKIIREQMEASGKPPENMVYLLIYSDGYTHSDVTHAFSTEEAARKKSQELNAELDPVSGLSYEVQTIN